jgi:LPXTG-site transpeptidase (sortase) family protein
MRWKHRYFGLAGIIAGSILAGIFTFSIFHSKSFFKNSPKTAFTAPTPLPKKEIIAPSAINIPAIGKNLPIKPATVRGNDWDLFDDAVAWLSTSATPKNGNVILYAHDWKSLWADLYKLKKGDPILVLQGNNWIAYSVTESRAVDLHDVQSILTDKDRLTLYTCEGNFDQKRRLVYAQRIY